MPPGSRDGSALTSGPAISRMENFTRQSRLTAAAEFDDVFREGRRSADELFTVLYRSNGLGYSRLGLAIAKKRVRRAIDRNRLKRLIRESFRAATPDLLGIDIVIMARDKAAGADNAAVFASLEHHWQSLRDPAEHLTTRPSLN